MTRQNRRANTIRVQQIRARDPKRRAHKIAGELGISRERVRQILVELGLPTDTREPRKPRICPDCRLPILAKPNRDQKNPRHQECYERSTRRRRLPFLIANGYTDEMASRFVWQRMWTCIDCGRMKMFNYNADVPPLRCHSCNGKLTGMARQLTDGICKYDHCGEPFQPTMRSNIYCSNRCRLGQLRITAAASYRRRKDEMVRLERLAS